jgi:catecholate siderophore receptor
MNNVRMPRSLRTVAAVDSIDKSLEINAVGKVSAVAGLIAVASFSAAEAQQSSLPPVTIDAPVARPHHAASKPTADHVRARTALRHAARRARPAQVAPVPFPNAGSLAADRNPYADAAAPYKVDHLQASGKFPEPLLNTPKTVTVLSKEVLADKSATLLRDVARTTAGVTLGTGEGGNAFGDRFFIRGFDARNDVFVDGVRDAGVSVRENFFTEQVEILRGPGSSFAGRGTTGGAINIVTKQANTERSFYNMDTTFGTDQTKRVTLDVNQVISPTLAIRAGGLFQDANVAGRNFITDDRGGGFVAMTWKPIDAIKVQANYIHTDLHGLPDFGVPYYRPGSDPYTSTAGGPFPEFGLNRKTFYGFLNRDFQSYRQDIGTLNLEAQVTPDITVTNKTRAQRSILNYIGTLPEHPTVADPNPLLWTLEANPQSRYQVTDVIANQTEATYKFGIGPWRHTALAGFEYANEKSSIDKYSGLSSEALPGFDSRDHLPGVNIFNPQGTDAPFPEPTLVGLPTKINIDTKSVYLLDTANFNDFIILNGGIRYDDYHINTSGYATVNNVPNVFGTQSLDSGLTNYNLGAVIKPLPYASIYAAYATSSNPVGAEFDGTSATYGGLAPVLNGNSNQIFGPEKNRAAEVGTKWELFDRHLLVSAALFETGKDNARESQNVANAGAATPACPYPAGTTGTVSCISAGAAYRIRGIDIEAAGKITDKWSLFAGLVLMQSEVTKSLAPSPQPLLYASNVGLPLANIAHQSFNVLTKYQLTDVWEVGGQATYRSKIYGGTLLAANQGTSLPSYWRFDAFTEAKINRNWKVKLAVNNITNQLYYDALYQSAAPFVFVAPGRVAYLTLSARY